MAAISQENMDALSADELRALIIYDPETGRFTWAPSRKWGWGGKPAGYIGTARRVKISVSGIHYFAHRLAWLYMTGAWPVAEIDHVNGDPSDNRWANLREATRAENATNYVRRRKRLLPRGVQIQKRRARTYFQAGMTVGGKFIYLGIYKTPELAHAAYLSAACAAHGVFLPSSVTSRSSVAGNEHGASDDRGFGKFVQGFGKNDRGW